MRSKHYTTKFDQTLDPEMMLFASEQGFPGAIPGEIFAPEGDEFAFPGSTCTWEGICRFELGEGIRKQVSKSG